MRKGTSNPSPEILRGKIDADLRRYSIWASAKPRLQSAYIYVNFTPENFGAAVSFFWSLFAASKLDYE